MSVHQVRPQGVVESQYSNSLQGQPVQVEESDSFRKIREQAIGGVQKGDGSIPTDLKSRLTDQRPPLNASISVKDFQEFYWWDHELLEFCQRYGLATDGRKLEKQDRILRYLQSKSTASELSSITSGRRSDTAPPAAKKTRLYHCDAEPTLDSVIYEDFKFNQQSRSFFEKVVGPHFKFTAHIGAYVRANFGKITYRDFIHEWEADRTRRKAGYKPPIMASCRYNQFVRDYLAANKGASFKDAVAAWKEVRDKRGDQKYKS
jgi:hypothetical protein